MEVTDSGRIWMYGPEAGNYKIYCLDGTQVASGTHPIPFGGSATAFYRGMAHASLSPDGQSMLCSDESRGLAENSNVQVTGNRVVVTLCAKQNIQALLAKQGNVPGNVQYIRSERSWFSNKFIGTVSDGWQYSSGAPFCREEVNNRIICQRIGVRCHILEPQQHIDWHFTVNDGEFHVATTRDARFALVLSDKKPNNYADMLFAALGIRKDLDIPYLLLFERPGLRAQLRLRSRAVGYSIGPAIYAPSILYK